MTHATSSASLFYSAQVAQAREQFLSLGVSLVLPLLRETGVDSYEVVENQYVVDAAKSLYTEDTAKWEMTGCYVITRKKGIQFYSVDVVTIIDKDTAPAVQEPEPTPVAEVVAEEPQTPAPAKEKPTPVAKAPKPMIAKVGGVKSKPKAIVDMSASELKKLANKHSISYEGVNFRKADEKDAFRSRVAKVLDRTSELNYSVK